MGVCVWLGARRSHSASEPAIAAAVADERADVSSVRIATPTVARTDARGPRADDLKRQLYQETDLRRKWAIVCRLATMPETETLFADPADRRRLDAIIEEVRLAIKRGELKEAEEEP